MSSDTPEQRFTGGLTWLAGQAMNDGYDRMRGRLGGADAQFSVARENYLATCEELDAATLATPSARSREILRRARNAQGFIRLARRQYDEVHEGLTTMMVRQRALYPEVWGQPRRG